ncbi:MAG: hypothetical protein L6N94_02505 [Candidatus Methylarchaceae archaeon HK01M]|nr:hypothetical protein [Candidatus Methylarchaceae archaeon HK01M]
MRGGSTVKGIRWNWNKWSSLPSCTTLTHPWGAGLKGGSSYTKRRGSGIMLWGGF